MADIVKELAKQAAAIMKMAPKVPREFFYPAPLVEQAAEMYKDRDWYINGYDGSRYYHGEQIKPPHESVDVTELNKRIAAMELPDYLQLLPKRDYGVYMLGEWGHAEKGENHEE